MGEQRPLIAVVGSANVDLTTFSAEFPRPGETLFGTSFDLGFGGKGANQAVAARLCGARVAMIAKVGDDLFGPATIRNFESLGIDARHVGVVAGMSSGVAPIFVEPGGQNRILVVKGANERLCPADVDAAAALLREASAVILQFEVPMETVCHTIRFCRKHGIRCLVNPAPAQAVDFAAMAAADYFIPNESEAQALTGLPVRTADEAFSCAEALLQRGLRRVVLTLGKNGAILATSEGMEMIPAYPVETLDTTGAGDAFIGSFAAFLAEGLKEREALRRASLYAALSTMRVGTQKSFAGREIFETEWKKRM